MKVNLTIRVLLITGLAVCFLLAGCAGTPDPTQISHPPATTQEVRRVFVLNSFNRGYTWTDNMLQGIDDAFKNSGLKIETYVTFMDMKRVPLTPEYFAELKKLIQTGYKNVRFDAVIACDNDAFDFMRQYRDELFPGVPVVFSSINDFDPSMLDGRKDITGTSENTDYKGTIELALKLRPATKNIIVVVDNTTTGKAHRSAVEKIRGDSPSVNFIYLSLADTTLEELAQKLSQLGNDSVVLLLQHFMDKNGISHTVQESTPLLTKSSSVPVFVLADTRMGLGALGGHVVSGYNHGYASAQMVVEILNGKDVASIPVLLNSPNQYMFDYNVMQRFGISESELPQGSKVINHPVLALDEYKNEIILISGAFIVLCAILVYLLFEIGRRRRIEAVLAGQSKFTSTLVDTIPALIYAYDMGTNSNVYSNRGIEQILGYTPEQIKEMGTELFERLVHPEDLGTVVAFQDKVAEAVDGEILEIEYRMKSADGRWVNIHSHESPFLRNGDGSLKQKIGVAIDVTARTQAEEALRESEKRYKMVSELTSDYIYKISVAADGKISLDFVTDSFYSTTGRDVTQARTLESWSNIFHPDDLGMVMKFLKTLIATHQPGTIECRTFLENGQMRWIEIIARPEWGENENRVSAIVGAVKDITERKRAEETLKKSEEKFSKSFQIGPEAITITCLEDGKYVEVNDVFLKTTGFQRIEVIGHTSTELNVWVNANDRRQFIEALLENGSLKNFEIQYRMRNGEIRDFSVSSEIIELDGKRCSLNFILDITESKRAAEALRQSEAKFRNMIDLSPVPYAMNDDEQNITYLNAAFIKTFGYDLQDIPALSEWWPKAYPDSDYRRWAAETWQARLDKVKAEGIEFEPMEANIQCKDGSVRTVLVGAGSLGESFKGTHLVIFYDITERKQTEEALAKSESMLRRVQEVSRIGSWQIDLVTKVVTASDEAYRIYGIPKGSMTLEQIQSIPLPEFRPILDTALNDLITQGNRYDVEFKIQRKSDNQILDVHSIAEYNAISKIIIGSIQDITERKRADEALAESEKRFRSILETISLLGVMLDTDGRITLCNDFLLNLTGWKREEILNQSWFDIFLPPGIREEIGGIFMQSIRDGSTPAHYVNEIITRQKEQRLIHWNNTVLRDQKGMVTGIASVGEDITARRKAEEALQKSEALYRRAIEVAGAVPYLQSYSDVGTGVNYDFIGEGIRQITGYGPEEFTDKLWDSITEERILLEDLARYPWGEAIRRVREGENSIWKCEHRIRARNGKIHWVFESAVELRNESGVAYGSIGLFQDITERKRAEEAIRENEILLKTVTENTPDAIMQVDQEGRITFINKLVPGLTKEQVIGSSIYNWVPKEQYSILSQVFADVFSKGESGEYESLGPGPNGESRFYYVRVKPVVIGEKTVSAIYTATDITERKQVELALITSENLYRKMTENSPLGMHFYRLNDDNQLIFTNANPAADKLLGIDNSQFIGKTIEEAFPPLAQTEIPERYRDAAAKGALWSTEQIVYEDKRIAGAFEVRAFQTAPNNMVAVFADVTARKQAEEQIRELNAELEQRVRDRTLQLETANKELEAFSYSVSHDLRAPLRGIDGWSQALLEDYRDKLSEEGQQYIDRVRSEAQRMGHLIEDMLQLSRLTRMEMRKEPVDLSALAQTIIERLKRESPQRQVKFIIQEGLNAKGDIHLLESALTNLLGNAFKFTSKTADAQVEFGQVEKEGEHVFFIRDNGAGFDMAYAQKLFGAFQRMHKAAEFPGTGIGLAIVQRVIHRHGGQIWADAKPNEGAVFYFTLPV